MTIRTVEELEEALSRPTAELQGELARLDGDLVVLGVAGKMGPTLARMARRALDPKRAVIGAARFSNPAAREALEKAGVKTVPCNLLERREVERLPDAAAVVFMAGMKFGSTGAEAETWATNTYLPGLVAERYPKARTVVFSTGNVYPFVTPESGGATEATPPAPVGEYAQSALGRERVFEYFSRRNGTPTAIYRLNYAVELRYGILLEIARKVWAGTPVDVRTGYVNVIWQGDANAMALRCLAAAESPASVFNVTGPETLSVRDLAARFGELLGRKPVVEGKEEPTALLSNASTAIERFGRPTPVETVLPWVAEWVKAGGPTLNKPTHFETRDGKF
jgi:nucleoside-diphosphate-sugar epimerase